MTEPRLSPVGAFRVPRIDLDIQEHVMAMEPQSLGQQAAIESTLQERRNMGVKLALTGSTTTKMAGFDVDITYHDATEDPSWQLPPAEKQPFYVRKRTVRTEIFGPITAMSNDLALGLWREGVGQKISDRHSVEEEAVHVEDVSLDELPPF